MMAYDYLPIELFFKLLREQWKAFDKIYKYWDDFYSVFNDNPRSWHLMMNDAELRKNC